MNDMRKLINLVESKLSESTGLPEVGDMYKGGMVRKVIGLTDDGFKTTRPEHIDYYKIIVSGGQQHGGGHGDQQYFVDKTGQEMNEAGVAEARNPYPKPFDGGTFSIYGGPPEMDEYVLDFDWGEGSSEQYAKRFATVINRAKLLMQQGYEYESAADWAEVSPETIAKIEKELGLGMNEAKVAVHPVTGKKKRFPDSATRDDIMAWKNSTLEPRKRSFSDMEPDEIDSLPTNTRSLGDQARMEKMQDDLEELSQQQEDYMINWRDYGLSGPEQGQAAAEELQPEMDNLMRKLDQMQGLGHFHEGEEWKPGTVGRDDQAVRGGITYKLVLSDEGYQQLRRDDMRGNAPIQKFKQINGVTHIKANNPRALAKYLEKIDPVHETSWSEIIDGEMYDMGDYSEENPVAYAGGGNFAESFMDILTRKGLFK